MSHKIPAFIIVGAPKAGTTFLYKYLEQHPRIYMPTKKEPLFFCEYPDAVGPSADAYNRNMVRSPTEYESLFEEARGDQLCGEASTDYLSCELAPRNIYRWNPTTRIIIILRNPIDRAYSEHMHLMRDCCETESFCKSIELEEERRKNGYVPLFRHVGRGLYLNGVKRYVEQFGWEQVKIIFFEDLVADPKGISRDLVRFLGLPDVEIRDPGTVNESGVPRFSLLQMVYVRMRSLPADSLTKKIVRKLTVRSLRQFIVGQYLKMNIRKSEGITPEERQMLAAHFRDDIEGLGDLLGCDLSHWLK